MQAKDLLKHELEFTEMVIGKLLDDLSDTDLLKRPAPKANHIAWQIGHLISSERFFIEAISPGASPPLPEGFDATHTRDGDAPASDDTQKFLKKAEYLDLYKKQRAATLAALDKMSESDLDKPGPERVAKIAPKFGNCFGLAAAHTLMHIGQFSVIRRQLGKPVVI